MYIEIKVTGHVKSSFLENHHYTLDRYKSDFYQIITKCLLVYVELHKVIKLTIYNNIHKYSV